METNSETNENQTAPPDDILENAEPPAEAVKPPAEAVEPPAEAVAPPAEPVEPPAPAEEPPTLPEKPLATISEFAVTSETKSESASEETGSTIDSENQQTSKGSETDAQSKEIPEVSDEKALKKARRKAERKGFFEKFDEDHNLEQEISEFEYEDSFLDNKLITTKSGVKDKLGSDSELSFTALDDREIETILKSDREDRSDELDNSRDSKQDTKDTVQMKDMFLKLFEMPSLSDISEEHEIEVKAPRKSKRKTVSIMKSDNNTITTTEVENVYENSDSSISSESSDGLDNLPLSNLGSLTNVTAPRKTDFADEEAFVMFKESVMAGEFEDRFTIKLQLQILTITMDFIQELIDKVVTECEQKMKHDHLKYKLNIDSLYDTLREAVQSHRIEKETGIFLNSRMVDYYKRLKNFRQIKDLPENLIIPEYQRYMEALKWFDHVLNVAKETKRKVSYLMSSVLMDITYVQNIMMDTEEHFENIILNSIGKRSEYLYKVAERELKLIEKKRNEISDERVFLITRKHTLARITHVSLKIYFTFSLLLSIYIPLCLQKINKLQKIDDDIYMDDFIAVQNQVVALDKKVDGNYRIYLKNAIT